MRTVMWPTQRFVRGQNPDVSVGGVISIYRHLLRRRRRVDPRPVQCGSPTSARQPPINGSRPNRLCWLKTDAPVSPPTGKLALAPAILQNRAPYQKPHHIINPRAPSTFSFLSFLSLPLPLRCPVGPVVPAISEPLKRERAKFFVRTQSSYNPAGYKQNKNPAGARGLSMMKGGGGDILSLLAVQKPARFFLFSFFPARRPKTAPDNLGPCPGVVVEERPRRRLSVFCRRVECPGIGRPGPWVSTTKAFCLGES